MEESASDRGADGTPARRRRREQTGEAWERRSPGRAVRGRRWRALHHSVREESCAVRLDDACENLIETDGRDVPDQLPDLRQIGDATRHVLEAGLVRLVVR